MRRPYRTVDRVGGPRGHYDSIIIGSGIGGLTCANLLAREGLRVLLLERHSVVGGYCSTFRRGGYTFDSATHFYPLLGNPATLTGKLLSELGVATEWIKMDPVDRFHLPDGTTFSVPADLDLYFGRLKSLFPAEAVAIDAFFDRVRELSLLGLLTYFREVPSPRLERHRTVTLRQELDARFRDPKLKLILTADCPHWGSPPSRTSFIFDSMLRLSYFLGNYYPRGGSQAFADELARRFVERGGEILLNAAARRIVVRDGAARGVEFEAGPSRCRGAAMSVSAGCVVANGDMRHTLEHLVGPEHLDFGPLRRVRELRTSSPCFLMHIGVRGMQEEALRAVHGYHWNDWDSDLAGHDGLAFKVFVPTLYDPSLAPAGGHVVILQKVTDVDFDSIDDWPSHKAEVERVAMARLKRLLPDLVGKIDVALSASAMTSHRFTGNRHGAMLGWEMSPDQLGDDRPGVVGPLKGLFFVGHWTRPGGGITPVIISAMRAAKAVLSGRPDDEAAGRGDGLVAAASAPSPQTIEAIHANLP